MGCTARRVFVSTVAPEGHGLTINGAFRPLEHVYCDSCNEPITGSIAHAITIAPPGREIGPWEHEYGTVLTDDDVKLVDIMEGKEAAK